MITAAGPLPTALAVTPCRDCAHVFLSPPGPSPPPTFLLPFSGPQASEYHHQIAPLLAPLLAWDSFGDLPSFNIIWKATMSKCQCTVFNSLFYLRNWSLVSAVFVLSWVSALSVHLERVVSVRPAYPSLRYYSKQDAFLFSNQV